MTTDYHAFYLSHHHHASLFFLRIPSPHDVGLSLFRNPAYRLVSRRHILPCSAQPLHVCSPPSLAAVLHIPVSCGFLVFWVGLWSSLSCLESVDKTKWRLQSAKPDDDDGNPGHWLMHGMGTTPTQDPEQSLRRNISPLSTSVARVHASPVSVALSCTLSFFQTRRLARHRNPILRYPIRSLA